MIADVLDDEAEWAALPHDGNQAWLGLVFVLASSAVTVQGLVWAGSAMMGVLMQ